MARNHLMKDAMPEFVVSRSSLLPTSSGVGEESDASSLSLLPFKNVSMISLAVVTSSLVGAVVPRNLAACVGAVV